MIPDDELKAYMNLVESLITPEPANTAAPYVYDPDEMSCYGYVTTDAVNFRAEPSSSSRRIRLMKKYALFIVYGSVYADGETWYKVSYNNQTGYVNGKYFKQMTIGEAEDFLNSSKYREGIANNTQTTTDTGNTTAVTTGTPAGIVSAEDQKVSEWVNPATGSKVNYEPFDPFATPEPLAENALEKNEFVNSLISQVESGTLKQEDIRTELEKFYKDAADPSGSVDKAMAYVEDKLGTPTEEPSASPEPIATVEPEKPQEPTSGGSSAGVIILILVLLAAAGGGYWWYTQKQRQREAAQRIAQKKVAQQKAMAGKDNAGRPAGTVPAQNAARVRTGTYTESAGSAKPKATPSTPSGTQGNGKAYRTGSKNPYGRYSSSEADEDSSYTASFKPSAGDKGARRDNKKPDDGKPKT